MLNYWIEIFVQALKNTIFTAWETQEGIIWSILVFVLTIAWLWRKHGWRGMRTAFWPTIGEGLLIAVVAFLVVLAYQFTKRPYDHWRETNERANRVELEKKSIETELEKEKDKSKPHLVGEIFGNAGGTHNGKAFLYVGMTLSNTVGAASGTKNWTMRLDLDDGRSFNGIVPIMDNRQKMKKIHNSKIMIDMDLNKFLPIKTEQAISAGSSASGWFASVFPMLDNLEEAYAHKAIIIVEFNDIASNQKSLGFSWTPNCDEDESEITRRCI